MDTRKIQSLFLILLSMSAVLYITDQIQAQDHHPFLKNLKEAYYDSKLTYDTNIEGLLFRKLPKPIDAFEISGLSDKLPATQNIKEQRILEQTIEALHRQFFIKVKTGETYCPVGKIKEEFGMTPKERIGISSGGYYRLFVVYWTLKIKLDENRQSNISKYGYGNVYYVDSLLRFVESNLAGAFFPTPGSMQISESTRRKGIQELLNMFAPTMTIKELYEGADAQKAGWPIFK